MKMCSWVVLMATFVSVEAFAHARFVLNGTTPPRNNSAGLKTGPCGGVARTSSPTVLVAGQQVKLMWEETVHHPGYYRIAFSPANDQGFDANVWVANVPDVQGLGKYEATVTVPNTPCTGCTLQMIQYMTETVPASLYFSCADIEIRPAGSPVPSPTPVPSPSTSPEPSNCH